MEKVLNNSENDQKNSDLQDKSLLDKKLIYKKIDNLIEIRKTLWTAFIVLNGGIFGLIINIISPFVFNISFFIKLFIILTGFIMVYVLMMVISENNKQINYLFNKF